MRTRWSGIWCVFCLHTAITSETLSLNITSLWKWKWLCSLLPPFFGNWNHKIIRQKPQTLCCLLRKNVTLYTYKHNSLSCIGLNACLLIYKFLSGGFSKICKILVLENYETFFWICHSWRRPVITFLWNQVSKHFSVDV